jgi:hypothetical protein
LILGENAAPAIFNVTTFTQYTSSDYNGFRPNPDVAASFRWSAPPAGTMADYNSFGHMAELTAREFATLEQYAAATGQDKNSVLVDYDVFVNVPPLDAQDDKTVQKLYDAKDLDFRLNTGSAAVDRGTPLATVTDGFAGRAPDLGALELGAPLPVYGPRR